LKDRIFYIGLALIGISFIACVISFYLLIFGIPMFILGAVLVFLSNHTIKIKLLTTLIPLILYFPLTYLFLFAYNYSTPKTILIPSIYEGTIRIIYEEKCGNNYDEIDGKKTLKFPENGILILNEEFDRHVNYKYYLIDKSGNKKEIPQVLDYKAKNKILPYILVGGSGTLGPTVHANSTYTEEKNITFSDFYVYNKDTANLNDFKKEQIFNSLTTEIVTKCRQRK